MTSVAILRALWGRRILVSAGALLAMLVGVACAFRIDLGALTFESRQYRVGLASAQVLIDSPNSQVIDLGGSGVRADVASLSVRARLLADLMATSPLKDRIALRARIVPSLLIALRPSTESFVEPTPLETGATVRTSDPRAHILSLRVQEDLPIVAIDAQAPSPATAARISNAAVTELAAYLHTAADAGAVPEARKLVADALGPARSSTSTRGPSRAIALVAALLAFCVWCAGVLVVPRFVRDWRQTALQNLPDAPAPTQTAADEPMPFRPPGAGRDDLEPGDRATSPLTDLLERHEQRPRGMIV